MTNTQLHAQKELDILDATVPYATITPFRKEILALCEAFGNSGQSGGSAPYTASALSQAVKKLCLQQTISPLTGKDSEYNEVGTDMYQNNRESAVFKQKDGRAYYLDAIVWKGDTWNSDHTRNDWDTFIGTIQGISSRQFIKSFPFKPKTFYIDVTREKFDESKHNKADAVTTGLDGDVVYTIKDQKQLEEVFEYYDKIKFELSK
jgi:hypothetical protein